ncbi:alpha/beta hydrolase [Ideonella azotifigens]|uniref:Alpha/beta hydrolase n=1 Tax=Ideonella azotifigens TaxID=513160 RepID=A0ABP3VG06_9BURK|nr:alpha/beta hydrolase [Ideonella azotifigens]MCD2344270.1 alpha/beta hydrolase [Ideonella azotifigens]
MELTVQGRRAYAYTGGKPFEPTLPCVVFLHGALNDHSVWTLLARWFAHHGHSVLAPDLPGHCRSEGPLLDSVETMADWTLALLDAAGARREDTLVAGHSMGSLIALETAARGADRIGRLAMMATAYPMQVSDALLSAARDTPAKGMAMVNAFALSNLASKPSYPGPGSWLHGAGLALMARVQASQPEANVFLHDFQCCNAYRRGLEAAAEVRCPVDFILGDADQMTPPRATRELAAALKAHVHRLPGGHSLMQEQPDGVLNVLRSALR